MCFSQPRKEGDQGEELSQHERALRVLRRGCPAAVRGPQPQAGPERFQHRGFLSFRLGSRNSPGAPTRGGTGNRSVVWELRWGCWSGGRRPLRPAAGSRYGQRLTDSSGKKTLGSAEEDGDPSWEREGSTLGRGDGVISHRSATSSRYQRR